MRLRLLPPFTLLAMLVAPASASAAFRHTIAPGESLSSIAAADGLSVSELAAANGLPLDAQLIAGSTVSIPAQSGSVGSGAPSMSASPSDAGTSAGDGDGDGDDAAMDGDGDTDGSGSSTAATASTAGTTSDSSSGSYVVQPGDTLTAIASRAGVSVSDLAAANGIDPNAVLPAGSTLSLSQGSSGSSAPAQAPQVGTTITGRMTWFGGPNDPSAQGVPASGLGWRSDGMAFYNSGSLRGRWLIHFPWGQTLPMTQIDLGPAPWTGNPFDIAFSALPQTPYSSHTWPNPVVTGTYQGG